MSLIDRVNWDETREEVARHLQELIRLNTVNPPGNESLVANYLKQQVEAAGLRPISWKPRMAGATSSPGSRATARDGHCC